MHIVTLTTDFGLKDYYVAELKANILDKAKEVLFVDVSHLVEAHDIVQAAYIVGNVYYKFPKGSIHLIGVNIHYQKHSRYIVMKYKGHYFVAPDNGVLSLFIDDIQGSEVFEIDTSKLKQHDIGGIYAHIVGYLKHGLPLGEIGPKVLDVNRRLHLQAVVTPDQIRATIIHIDHYENVVINVTEEQFKQIGKFRDFKLFYRQNDPIDHLSRHYSDVAVGEVLCLFNSAGYLEIAINMGKASSLLNLQKNETVQINFF